MRVFVGGATGALGRPLVKKLLERGHHVTGLTRDPVKGAELAAAGATPVIADIFEAETVLSAIEAARPDAIISELTALPQRLNPRKLAQYYAANDRVRREGRGRFSKARGASMSRASSLRVRPSGMRPPRVW